MNRNGDGTAENGPKDTEYSWRWSFSSVKIYRCKFEMGQIAICYMSLHELKGSCYLNDSEF